MLDKQLERVYNKDKIKERKGKRNENYYLRNLRQGRKEKSLHRL